MECIDAPALLIVGSEDVLTPPAQAEALARLLPRAELAILEGAAHALLIERDVEITRRIDDQAGRTAKI